MRCLFSPKATPSFPNRSSKTRVFADSLCAPLPMEFQVVCLISLNPLRHNSLRPAAEFRALGHLEPPRRRGVGAGFPQMQLMPRIPRDLHLPAFRARQASCSN